MNPELTVIGAGPAGLAAATAASESGVKTTIVDEQEYLGGQYFRQPRGSKAQASTDGPSARGADAIAALREAGVSPLVRATAYSAGHGQVEVDLPAGRRTLDSAVVIASGATERVVPLPGWTLPGVVTCGGAQSMLKMFGEPVGGRVLVAGSGPFLLPVAAALIRSGASVPRIVEAQKFSRRSVFAAFSSPAVIREAAGHLWAISSARSRLRTGWGVVRIDQVSKGLRVMLGQLDDGGKLRPGGGTEVVECDAVCLSDGFIPSVGLGQLAGSGLRFLPGSRSWGIDVKGLGGETGAQQVWAAGACVSPWSGAGLSTDLGELAGRAVAAELLDRPRKRPPRRIARNISLARRLDRAFPVRPGWYQRTTDDVVVCRCENVAAGAIREAAAVSPDVSAVKRMTRAGMGLCQGRTCQAAVAELTAEVAAAPIDAVGRFSARSPDRPTSLETLAGPLREAQ